MATGIRDKVAIIGMGCTRFGERWDVGAEELMVEAFSECLEDAGIGKEEIQAAWLGTCLEEINVGKERPAPIHHPQAPLSSRSPERRISAPAEPRHFGGPSMRWHPGPTMWPWPWGLKSSKTAVTAGFPIPDRAGGPSAGCGGPMSPRPAHSPSWPPPTPPNTAFPIRT
jgi:hypothetical protein